MARLRLWQILVAEVQQAVFEDLIGCREGHPVVIVFAVVLDHRGVGRHGALVAG